MTPYRGPGSVAGMRRRLQIAALCGLGLTGDQAEAVADGKATLAVIPASSTQSQPVSGVYGVFNPGESAADWRRV